MAKTPQVSLNQWSAFSKKVPLTLKTGNVTLDGLLPPPVGQSPTGVSPQPSQSPQIESAPRRSRLVLGPKPDSCRPSLASSPDTSAPSAGASTPASDTSGFTSPWQTPTATTATAVDEVRYKVDGRSSVIGLGTEFPSLAEAATIPKCRPSQVEKVKKEPIAGKIYFLPDGKHLSSALINTQKRDAGFFNHPVLITEAERDSGLIYFYACTKERPNVIRALDMALRIGTSSVNDGPGVLRLAPDSNAMAMETWVNLEQRYWTHFSDLQSWDIDVRIDPNDLGKLDSRITELEADQNRFIYKPLPRPMTTMEPGTVLMLLKEPSSPTRGTPVLILENTYPNFRFLPIKRLEDNINFAITTKTQRYSTAPRTLCLAISKEPKVGHDGTPVVLLEPDSPELRGDSYVEIRNGVKVGQLNQCKTWCWPPIKISKASLATLQTYMANLPSPIQSVYQQTPHAYAGPSQPPRTPFYGNFYQPNSCVYESQQATHNAAQSANRMNYNLGPQLYQTQFYNTC